MQHPLEYRRSLLAVAVLIACCVGRQHIVVRGLAHVSHRSPCCLITPCCFFLEWNTQCVNYGFLLVAYMAHALCRQIQASRNRINTTTSECRRSTSLAISRSAAWPPATIPAFFDDLLVCRHLLVGEEFFELGICILLQGFHTLTNTATAVAFSCRLAELQALLGLSHQHLSDGSILFRSQAQLQDERIDLYSHHLFDGIRVAYLRRGLHSRCNAKQQQEDKEGMSFHDKIVV